MFNRAQKLTLVGACTAITLTVLVGATVGTNTIPGHAVAATTTTTAETYPTDDGYPAEDTAPVTGDDLYLSLVGPEIPEIPDAELIIAGLAVCGVLDDTAAPDTATVAGIGDGIVDAYGVTYYQAGYLLGAAVNAYCDRYRYLIT